MSDDTKVRERIKFADWKIDLVQEHFNNSNNPGKPEILEEKETQNMETNQDLVDPDIQESSIINDPLSNTSSNDATDEVGDHEEKTAAGGDINHNVTKDKTKVKVKVLSFEDDRVDSDDMFMDSDQDDSNTEVVLVSKDISIFQENSQDDSIIEEENQDDSIIEAVSSQDSSIIIEESSQDTAINSCIRDILTDMLDNLASVQVTLLQHGAPVNSIVEVDDDSSDDDDEEILSLKFVAPTPMKVVDTKVLSVDSLLEPSEEIHPRIIVDDIIEDLISEIVEQDPQVIAYEIISECLEMIDFSKTKTPAPPQTTFVFASSDIRYRKDASLPGAKDTGLSLLVLSLHNHSLFNFIMEIKKLQRRTIYENSSSINRDVDLVRLDYIFRTSVDRKAFENKVSQLPKPPELVLETKSVPAELLCHKEQSPCLTEEELLVVVNDAKTENLFNGFDVELIVKENKFLFKFESIMVINTFLLCTVGLHKGFLGLVRQNSKVFTPLKLKSYFNRRTNVSVIPVDVTVSNKFSQVNVKDIVSKFGGNIYKQRGKDATINFRQKEKFYKFLTSRECRCFEKINFTVKS